MDQQRLQAAANALKTCHTILVLTGAGISQESGVPTFRGKDGLWKKFRAEQMATPEAFAKDPQLVWEWYDWRRRLIKPLKPNAGHNALVTLEYATKQFTLVTQNVDGLHRLAGNTDPVEMHGSLWQVRCTQCGMISENRDTPMEIPPRCKSCHGLLRPNVVWFGEPLDQQLLGNIYQVLEKADAMLVVGTSGLVQPAASFGLIAKRAGAFVVEVNRSKTQQSPFFDLSLTGKAGDILPALVEALVS